MHGRPGPDELSRAGEDLSDVMVDLILGYECNARCDYCSVSDGMRLRNMSTADAVAEVARARRLGIHRIAFGGGEPTIRRDLLPLVRFSRDRGFDSVKVSSNGLMYSYDAYAREAVEAGITLFHVSAMAHEKDLYDRILGVPGGLDLVTKGVTNLISLGQSPVLDLIIKSDTHEVLADIVSYWAGVGVRSFALWLVALVDRNCGNLASLPRVTDMRDGVCRALDRGRELGVEIWSRHIPPCMLPGHESFCRDLREDRVLVVTPDSRFFLWESAISPSRYTPKCEGCRYRGGTCRGVRRDYLDRYGDAEVAALVER